MPSQSFVGLVIGRFQPLHPGHLALIDTAMRACGEIVVCIGSVQRAEPFTAQERFDLLTHQLAILYPEGHWRIVVAADPTPLSDWIDVFLDACQLEDTAITLFRCDPLSKADQLRFKNRRVAVTYALRQPFYYLFPDGYQRKVSSATEIKAIYAQLNLPLTDRRIC